MMSEDNLDGRHYGFSGITLSGPVQLSTRLETIGGITWGLYGSVCVCVYSVSTKEVTGLIS